MQTQLRLCVLASLDDINQVQDVYSHFKATKIEILEKLIREKNWSKMEIFLTTDLRRN